MVTLPDDSVEPTGDVELKQGQLQRLVEGSPMITSQQVASVPTQAYANDSQSVVEENPFQQQAGGLLGGLLNKNAPQETQVSGVEKLNTKPVGSMPPPLEINNDDYFTEDDMPF
jgi:hypothetical protein